MKKYIISILAIVLFLGGASFAFAQEEDTADPTIQQLIIQIEALKEQIEMLREQMQQLVKQQQILKEGVLTITRQLEEGMQGEDVKKLQQLLSTDPEIYPEGLITGYFGPKTRRAVEKFQERAGVDQVGRVGPQTLARINEIFQYGVEGKGAGLELHGEVLVPPGLLRAPGIIRLMGEAHPRFHSLPINGENDNGDDDQNDDQNGED